MYLILQWHIEMTTPVEVWMEVLSVRCQSQHDFCYLFTCPSHPFNAISLQFTRSRRNSRPRNVAQSNQWQLRWLRGRRVAQSRRLVLLTHLGFSHSRSESKVKRSFEMRRTVLEHLCAIANETSQKVGTHKSTDLVWWNIWRPCRRNVNIERVAMKIYVFCLQTYSNNRKCMGLSPVDQEG